MERERIVTNGCSGGCCTKFTLPVSLEDLKKMKESYIEARLQGFDSPVEKILCSNGIKRFPPPEEELDKYLDMLIPLGVSSISPQSGKPLDEVFENYRDRDGEFTHWDISHNFIVRDNHLFANIFTCKYFDTENKICTNYEDRPNLCKAYGHGCKYQGCNFDKILEEEVEKDISAMEIDI